MTTYTYDIATNIGKIRLTIGDKVPADGDTSSMKFSDEELQYFLDQAPGDITRASITALESWVRELATRPKLSLGDYQEDYSDIIKTLTNQITYLRSLISDQADDVAVDVGGGAAYYRQDNLFGWGVL